MHGMEPMQWRGAGMWVHVNHTLRQTSQSTLRVDVRRLTQYEGAKAPISTLLISFSNLRYRND